MNKKTVTNFSELRHVVTQDNTNSLALLDTLIDATWTFSGSYPATSKMRHTDAAHYFWLALISHVPAI